MENKVNKINCRTDSKKHCMACCYYDYCDKANRCNGDCFKCDDFDCENKLNKLAKCFLS